MGVNELYNVLGIIRIFICLLLILFLFTVKSKRALSNKLFAIFLMLIIIDFNGNWFTSYYKNDLPNFDMFRNTLAFLQLPVFYLYVLSICYSDFRLRTIHLIHVLPLLIVNIVLSPNYYLANEDLKAEFMNEILGRSEIISIYFFIHILVAAYTAALLITLRRYRKVYFQNYALTGSINYKWLLRLVILVIGIYTVALIKNIFKYLDYDIIFEWIKILLSLVMLFTICWYLMLALRHPQLFRSVDSKLKPIKEVLSTKTFESAKTDEEERAVRLMDYMADKEPYLESDLTIQNLACRMNLSERDLSILINHYIGQHFFDFVNKFRIGKAMEILRDPKKVNKTILEILYEVGFNSKSSFNTAFKKHCGTTPSEYRKRCS